METLESEITGLSSQAAWKSLKEDIFEALLSLEKLTKHPTFSKGLVGEHLVSMAVIGKITGHTEGHDVATKTAKIEVKFASPNRTRRNSKANRWAWAKVLGQSGSKNFDYLVLLADWDPQTRVDNQYNDELIFCVVIKRSKLIALYGAELNQITMSTNFNKVGRSSKFDLLHEYAIRFSDLSSSIN